MSTHAESLRKAIENLIDAKLNDALARPNGLERLRAHRMTGVASPDIRNAERLLEETLEEVTSSGRSYRRRSPRNRESVEMMMTD